MVFFYYVPDRTAYRKKSGDMGKKKRLRGKRRKRMKNTARKERQEMNE